MVGELLDAAGEDSSVKGDTAAEANLREMKRDYDHATKLPKSLVEEIARCSSLGMDAWKEAKKNSDFKTFLPWLEKTVSLNRQKAECLGLPEGGKEHYDALLDIYEPGMTAAKTDAIFGPFRERLVPLIRTVNEVRNAPSDRPARAMTPIDLQKKFSSLICEKIGFDFQAGRIDESAHPFCEGVGPGDTRMTNRYRPDGWADALGTAMHESGHALYEQGLPKHDRFGQPLAEPISLGIHESQSRMWENQVGRSMAFWKWAISQAHKVFEAALMAYSAEDVYKAVNLVKPNLIRVESDELTYNLHIMLRFDLERAMISGKLSPRDLPGVWNDRIYKDLGLQVPDDRRGCLQDVHWSMGALGYFPTYTFGNLYAAQFWEAMEKDIKDRDERMARGEFAPILTWLRENIHRYGRQFSAEQLCKKITGKPLSHDPLMRHLEKKVSTVYGV
jgi:carboxypeptidase Taq